MQYRRFIRDSASPAPTHESRPFDGIRFYKSFFPEGSYQTYSYPVAIKYSETPTLHIQTVGRMSEPSGQWPVHEAGWMSRDDGFIIPAGTFTRYAEEDSIRWCCLGRGDSDFVDYVRSVHLAHGNHITLAMGESILPVTGSLACGAARIPSEVRARCSSGPKDFVADGDVLAFVW